MSCPSDMRHERYRCHWWANYKDEPNQKCRLRSEYIAENGKTYCRWHKKILELRGKGPFRKIRKGEVLHAQ